MIKFLLRELYENSSSNKIHGACNIRQICCHSYCGNVFRNKTHSKGGKFIPAIHPSVELYIAPSTGLLVVTAVNCSLESKLRFQLPCGKRAIKF